MPEPAAASSLTRHPSFVLFWCARTFTNGAYMMQGVAVGWQIYELTNDPFDLGLVGLVQFVPLVALSVVTGRRPLRSAHRRRYLSGGQSAGGARARARHRARLAHPRRHAGHPVRVGHRARV